MHGLHIAGILLSYGPTLVMNQLSDSMKIRLAVARDEAAKTVGMEAKDLIQTDSLKVPEIQCGRNYTEEGSKLIDDLVKKYPKDSHKQMEEAEVVGEDTTISCFLPLRDEMNCKSKCEGNTNPTILCVCGPKKCKLDSDGLCEKKGLKDGDGKDEKDGSSSLFIFGTMLNLTIFYLIASFF